MCSHSHLMRSQQFSCSLDKETLAAMSAAEREFWLYLLDQAHIERELGENSGDTVLTPSLLLAVLHRRALRRYNGEQYCEMEELEKVFAFPAS